MLGWSTPMNIATWVDQDTLDQESMICFTDEKYYLSTDKVVLQYIQYIWVVLVHPGIVTNVQVYGGFIFLFTRIKTKISISLRPFANLDSTKVLYLMKNNILYFSDPTQVQSHTRHMCLENNERACAGPQCKKDQVSCVMMRGVRDRKEVSHLS